MSSNLVKIGVACPIPGERAAFLEWLSLAGYEPIPMISIDSVGRDLASRPLQALIADVSLVSPADLPRIVKILGANRPLILVGDAKDAIEDVPKDAAWIDRPVTRDTFLLSVALALAEGRPARRSPRRLVPRLLSSVDGVTSKVVDVSVEGVRLEITGASPSALPPYFTLRVPRLRGCRKGEARVGRNARTRIGVVRRHHRASAGDGDRCLEQVVINAPAGTTQITEIRAIT